MAVTACTINARQILADGQDFGPVGSYEQLDGTAHFAVDPDNARNGDITDLHLAPRDEAGTVHFSADIRILKPVDMQRGNQRLLQDVPNRGRRTVLPIFNGAQRSWTSPSGPMDLGDGFLLRQGYTVAWCGWQHDIPDVDGLLGAQVPEAVGEDGRPVSGKLMVNFQPDAPTQVQPLGDRQHRPYPAADLDEAEATLLVWDEDEEPFAVIPRHQWSFARLEEGQVVPDACHVYLAAGFEAGRRYQVIYTTTGAPVVGLGLVATRDMASFLRYSAADNPCAGGIEYAYAFGASQSGSYLRQFLYLGLNEDEEERPVFDGVLAHIGSGSRGVAFNLRFGQLSGTIGPRLNSAFPFADTSQTDPETGQADGLLTRLTQRQKLPKIFFTNTANEYWKGTASLLHTDASGTRDVEPLPSVRVYHIAGAQHVFSEGGTAALPLTDSNAGMRGEYLFNCVDYRPLMRAALVRMDRWVSAGQEPAPSCYPRLGDGTAVSPGQTAVTFAAISGVQLPAPLPSVARLDFGLESGVARRLPPTVGRAYGSLVAAVDADGNELSGIRLPDISVPLATYTGWNRRHRDMGTPGQMLGTVGSTLPFAPTKAKRQESGDPRLSIEERYASKADFLERVGQAAGVLVEAGYLLAEDVGAVLERASQRYDLLCGPMQSAR